MAKGRMTEVVGEGDGFGEVLVEAERARHGSSDAGDLDGVGHPRAVMVAAAVEEDLGLVFEAAERAAVDDAVAVALEVETEAMLVLGKFAAPGGGAVLGVRREVARLASLQIKTAARH